MLPTLSNYFDRLNNIDNEIEQDRAEVENETIREGFAILQIGRTKSGKTFNSKKLISETPRNKSVYVYDINREYTDIYPAEFVPFEQFMNRLHEIKPVNSVILIEEATIFFSVRSTNKILTDLLVRKRHTGNIIILNFHSFGQVPKYVFDLVDYVVIFKTNDRLQTVKDRTDYDNVITAFTEINNSPNLKNSEGKEYSPSKSISLY